MKSTKFIKPIALVKVVDSAESMKSRYSMEKLDFDDIIEKVGSLLRKHFDMPKFKAYDIIDMPEFKAYDMPEFKAYDMPKFKAYDIIDMPKFKAYVGENRREYRMVDFRRIAAREIVMFKLIVMNGDKVKNRVSNCLPMSENSVCTRGDNCIETRTNIMPFRKKVELKNTCAGRVQSSTLPPVETNLLGFKKKLGRLWETADRLLKVTLREFSSGYSHLAVFNDCQITAREVRTGPTSVIADRIYALTNNAEVVMTKRIQHNMFAV